ncbi:hypothetical protein PY092_08355 [Muricauda sp. 334s03]|uniref:Uncharacterized protein n=1 Tax=Flagellimonas yonaguniensis TaxID=3031325 RepID=A0ABT5XY93_9FLAO|nr:hypothetical protein [[Muricauda] yonaguniensis]MDF0716153.1 hypothetical protein [[Muricauda] yonaguniensis]
MAFFTITNLARNTVSISFLLAMLFCQKDESNDYSTINRLDFLEEGEEALFKKRIHLGFSKYGEIRLQQSIDDTRQLF